MNWSKFDLVGYSKALYEGQVRVSEEVCEAFGVRSRVIMWEDLSSENRAQIIASAYVNLDKRGEEEDRCCE